MIDLSKLPRELAQWYDHDFCLASVERNITTLQSVKHQTPEMVDIFIERLQNYIDKNELKLEKRLIILQWIDFSILSDEKIEEILIKFLF